MGLTWQREREILTGYRDAQDLNESFVFQNKNNPARDSNPSHWDIGLLVSGLGYKIGYWWLWVSGFG